MIWLLFCLADPNQVTFSEANNRANELFRNQQYEEALQAYLDLYTAHPESGALAYNLANTYMALGDQEKAQNYFQKAMNSDHPEAAQNAQYNLASTQLSQQNFQDAINNYVDYLKKNPDDEDAKRNLELALRQIQQQQQQQQDQDQEQNQQEQDQEQSQQSQDSAAQKQEEEKSEQNQDEQSNQDQQDSRNTEDPSQGQQDQEQKDPSNESKPDPQQGEQKPQDPSDFDEKMKQQILQALEDQEQKAQEEYQKRKIGRVKRRAKDW